MAPYSKPHNPWWIDIPVFGFLIFAVMYVTRTILDGSKHRRKNR